MEVTRAGSAVKSFQAVPQASTMSAWLSKTRLPSWFWRRYYQMFSAQFSSGE